MQRLENPAIISFFLQPFYLENLDPEERSRMETAHQALFAHAQQYDVPVIGVTNPKANPFVRGFRKAINQIPRHAYLSRPLGEQDGAKLPDGLETKLQEWNSGGIIVTGIEPDTYLATVIKETPYGIHVATAKDLVGGVVNHSPDIHEAFARIEALYDNHKKLLASLR